MATLNMNMVMNWIRCTAPLLWSLPFFPLFSEATLSQLGNSQFYLGGESQHNVPEAPVFGVGIDLSASYGTLAISGLDDLTSFTVKVQADDGYVEVMSRLSLDSSRHLSPPYQHIGDSVEDEPRQALRSSRKAMGLPASEDVGHLANMLIALRDKAQEHVPSLSSQTGITLPDFPAIYAEDLSDACEFAGIDYIVFPHRFPHELLYETAALYVSSGHGLCENYHDQEKCRAEERDMEFDVVMAVLYTKDVLTVSMGILHSAYYLREGGPRHYSTFELGYSARERHQDAAQYWQAVENFLRRPFGQTNVYNVPKKVLLSGDYVEQGEFRRALKRALDHELQSEVPIFSHDADVAAAKGAAELTKRLLWAGDHE